MSYIIRTNAHTSLPYCLLDSTNYSDVLHYFKQKWVRSSKPCVHPRHHKWYDVFKGRAHLRNLSAADQQRVFYRHCQFVLDHTVLDTNPYRFWLNNHVSRAAGFAFEHFDMEEVRPTSDHPADIVAAKQRTHERRRMKTLKDYRASVLERYTASIASLRKYGKKCFGRRPRYENLFTDAAPTAPETTESVPPHPPPALHLSH